jgi:hypothetical protein
MKRNRLFIPIGMLIFFALCFVPGGEAQSCANFAQGAAPNWNIGMKCTFNAGSAPVSFFSAGSVYWQVFYGPAGTVSAATLSLDSSATGLSTSWSTGGILSTGTIGAMTSAGSYSNSTPTTPSNYAQLTPTITGTGSVTVVIFGFSTYPSGNGGGAGSTVTVTNFPATQPVSGTVTSNVQGHAGSAVDAAPGATAPNTEFGVGGVYNNTPQTPSNGSFEPLQIDANSYLETDTQAVGGSPLSLFATLFNGQAATGTATSAPIRAPGQSAVGILVIQGAGITGSPVGCQISIEAETSLGSPASSSIGAQTFTPGNSYQSFLFNPTSSVNVGADQILAIFTCGTYPTGGTISVTFEAFTTTFTFLYGHSGLNVDTTAGGGLPAAIIGVAGKTQSSASNGAAGTSAKAAQPLLALDGTTYTVAGGSFRFSNTPISISTNTTTQLIAAPAAGFVAYVTDILFNVTTAGSATTLQIVFGTGTNCGTGTTALSVTIPDTTAGLQQIHFTEPLVPATAATAICVTQAGTTAGTASVQVAGYIEAQ